MGMQAREELGARGEDVAVRFFADRGAELVERNWRCRFGEMDLLVRLKGVLHIVEVKTRAASMVQGPSEAISAKKCQRLERAFQAWCDQQALHPDRVPHQFDAFFVWNERGKWRSFWLEGL